MRSTTTVKETEKSKPVLNSSDRTVNAGKNALSAFINKLVILCLTFISRKVVIQYIGVEYFGINGLFSNILTLLAMADLGLGTAMNVSLYKPIAVEDTDKLSALLNYYKKLYYWIAAAVAALGMAAMPFLQYIVKLDNDIPHIRLYYAIFVAKSAVSYLFVYKSSIIKADQKMHTVNRIDIFVKVAKVIAQIITTVLFRSYLVFILLEVAGVIAHNLIVSFIADKNYPFIKEKKKLPEEDRKKVRSDVSSMFLYKISWSLINGTDNILMSMMIGTIYVGYYSNYHTITHNLSTFIALLFTSLTASVGNLVAKESPDKRFRTFKSMQMVSFWICGFVSVCLLFLTQDFIELFFGKELLLDNLTLAAIILNLFFSTCMRPVWTFREGTGMYRQIRYIMFVTALLNIGLSIVLGKLIGISGILFATSISKLLTYFWFEPNILFRDFFHQKVRYYYIDYACNAAIMIVCALLCGAAIQYTCHGVTLLNWFIKAGICFVIINAIYFLRYCRTDEFDNIKVKAAKLLKKRFKKSAASK